jgi:hypothetical protein
MLFLDYLTGSLLKAFLQGSFLFNESLRLFAIFQVLSLDRNGSLILILEDLPHRAAKSLLE